MLEECDAFLPLESYKFVACMNVLFTEADYHNVGIFMFAKVTKSEFTFKNTEPDKCTDWHWVKWEDFIKKDPLFIPFKYFFEQGYDDLNKIKKQVGLL